MKILLISPVIGDGVRREKGLLWPSLALYIIEGLTPEGHEVRIVEEEFERVPVEEKYDLVGISCMTANAPRAYQLADDFRKRGIKVILGGIHPTILPDEALNHADSVVIGEAEGVWGNVLEDLAGGNLLPKYHNPDPDLGVYIPKNFAGILKRKPFNVLPVCTTRGCPYDCDFCSVSRIYGKKIRHVPVDNVVRDIVDSGSKKVIFYDDNIIGQPKYAKELFKAIKPLKIRWAGQATISLIRDTELMELAAGSGCMGLLIGLESVSVSQMSSMKKCIGERDELRMAIRKIMQMGILVHATMISGFDNDTPEVFEDTVRFLIDCQISSVSFCILTPLPGTRTYEQMVKEGRLITNDWKYFNNRTVVFKPRNMSPSELQLYNWKEKKEFYGIRSIMKRLPGNIKHSAFHLISNYTYIKHVKTEKLRIARLEKELFTRIA
ncbi:MAG: B12-binding domain-containing radical SAM protein [Bacteroidales bacterium]|nr:B12-binding domain-containing radical SAM protein [Bacteroidales bacterium]